MTLATGKRRAAIDWISFSLYLTLLIVGCLMVYSSGYQDSNPKSIFDLSTFAGRQVMWCGASLTVFIFIQIIDEKFWRTFAYPIYMVIILLLVLVLFLGSTLKGQTASFSIGGFSLQPSELAKFATCLTLSSYLSGYSVKLNDAKSAIIAFGILLLPMGLILLQPDAGSALVFASMMLVIYREGFSRIFFILLMFTTVFLILGLLFSLSFFTVLIISMAAAVLVLSFKEKIYNLAVFILTVIGIFISYYQEYTILAISLGIIYLLLLMALLWKEGKSRMVFVITPLLFWGAIIGMGSNYLFNNILMPHQKDRINVWLHPDQCDPRGSLYNVLQSKMAISAGGFSGKGYLEGNMTKLNYVPEQNTDFIFCTVGEEQGFIGSALIIILYCTLLLRMVHIAERQRLPFKRHFTYGVVSIFFAHFIINIGMTVGLMPVIGIPLPFMSYGGSSMIGFTLLLATMLKFDSDRVSL